MSLATRLRPAAAFLAAAASSAAIFGFVAVPAAQAACAAGPATFNVTTTTDENDGGTSNAIPGADGTLSLREAIAAANSDSTNNTINVPSGNYALSLGALSIDNTCPAGIAIVGGGARST